jgi:hypothetical protein
MKILSEKIIGYVDMIEILDNSITVEGWAINKEKKMPCHSVQIFIGDNIISEIPILFARLDVAHALNNHNYVNSGFKYILSKSLNVDYQDLIFYGFLENQYNRLILTK